MRFPVTTRRADTATSPLSLFDNFFREFFTDPVSKTPSTLSPRVNIAESESAVTLEFALPGVQPDAIDVEVLGNRLSLEAERKQTLEGDKLHAIEHQHGKMRREIALPRGLDTDAIEAKFEHGVLTLTIPKTEPAKARKIEIKS